MSGQQPSRPSSPPPSQIRSAPTEPPPAPARPRPRPAPAAAAPGAGGAGAALQAALFPPHEGGPPGGGPAGGKRTIRRKGYTRKAYTRKSGIHVKGSHVPAGRIADVGHPGKGVLGTGKPGIGPLKEGELVAVGYKVTLGKSARHRALNKAIKRYGALPTYRKLNAIAVYTKRTSPTRSKTFKADRNYVGRKVGYKST